MICHICWCANICLIGSPIKNLCTQVSDALQNISAIWVDQTYTQNNSSEHQSTCNRDHLTFLGSLGKVSFGQIYLGIIEGPAAFLLFPPHVANGPMICSGERPHPIKKKMLCLTVNFLHTSVIGMGSGLGLSWKQS